MRAWEEELGRRLLAGDVPPPDGTRAAAVTLILRRRETLEILLIERIQREGDPWSGHIALPGGMAGPRDRSLAATARREAREEVDIRLEEACTFLGRLPELRPSNVPQITVYPFVYALQKEVTPRAGDEAEAWFWAPLPQLRRSRTVRHVEVRGRELVVPAYLQGERVVWGLTYRILTTFFETGFDAGSA